MQIVTTVDPWEAAFALCAWIRHSGCLKGDMDCIQIVLAKYPIANPYMVGLLISTLVSKHLDTAVAMTVGNDSLRSPRHRSMSFVSCYPKWAGGPSSVLLTLMIPLAVLPRTLASVIPLIPPLMLRPIIEIDELASLATDQLVETSPLSVVSFALACQSLEELTLRSLWKQQRSLTNLVGMLLGLSLNDLSSIFTG